jgi:hypothetical protein
MPRTLRTSHACLSVPDILDPTLRLWPATATEHSEHHQPPHITHRAPACHSPEPVDAISPITEFSEYLRTEHRLTKCVLHFRTKV